MSYKSLLFVLICFFISACGGGGDTKVSSTLEPISNNSNQQNNVQPQNEPQVVDPEPEITPEPVPPEPPSSECQLLAIDEAMLALVNEARSQARMCGTNSMPAVSPLTWNCRLALAAAVHSEDMASMNFFSHTGSDGLSMVERSTAAGYEYRALGENIAAGYTTVEQVMAGWLNSPGHCRNIMSANFTEMGAARRINDNSDFRTYWTQVFGRPR